MKNTLEGKKAFMMPFEAYYAETSVIPFHKYPFLMIGFYYENDGTDGEFMLVWDDIGIQLQAYNDSWEVLSKMPELIELLALIDKDELKPSINEFARKLIELGYKDLTNRTDPYSFIKLPL